MVGILLVARVGDEHALHGANSNEEVRCNREVELDQGPTWRIALGNATGAYSKAPLTCFKGSTVFLGKVHSISKHQSVLSLSGVNVESLWLKLYCAA